MSSGLLDLDREAVESGKAPVQDPIGVLGEPRRGGFAFCFCLRETNLICQRVVEGNECALLDQKERGFVHSMDVADVQVGSAGKPTQGHRKRNLDTHRVGVGFQMGAVL